MKNRYFVCLPDSDRVRSWSPEDPHDLPIADCAYFGRVLTAFERSSCREGLTFYVTWNVSWLPSYGPDVVAIVLGDEWCRFPTYTHRVRAVFKCYGIATTMVWKPIVDPRWVLLMLETLRQRAPFLICRWKNFLLRRRTVIWDIPLGYFNQLELPIIPIAERETDVFFSGSIGQDDVKRRTRRRTRQIKEISRRHMSEAVGTYARLHPERTLNIRTTTSFGASVQADKLEYSRALQNAKVCLVPQGTSLETFRWFEGLRYGCIVVCESLPKRRYYTGAPVFIVKSWRCLPALLERVLSDRQLLEAYHQSALRWWQEKCGEEAVGNFIAVNLP